MGEDVDKRRMLEGGGIEGRAETGEKENKYKRARRGEGGKGKGKGRS